MAGAMTSLNQIAGFRTSGRHAVSTYMVNGERSRQAAGTVNGRPHARKRNMLLFGAVWTIGVLMLLWVWNGSANAADKATSFRVASGDTLWKIAKEVSPTQDPRVVTNEIIQMNHMSGSEQIYPGEVLKVPTH